jgi:hypothetical protein
MIRVPGSLVRNQCGLMSQSGHTNQNDKADTVANDPGQTFDVIFKR